MLEDTREGLKPFKPFQLDMISYSILDNVRRQIYTNPGSFNINFVGLKEKGVFTTWLRETFIDR